ncbi:UNVERIFIED_CONTAM: putative ribonuclease H protein [Sesamum latifolium]|uniref:Ribonuclease H protein n=1 Tax=Sesamum latifolium TaxID=2727402 RepID=A0AAW2WT05_9LAMI
MRKAEHLKGNLNVVCSLQIPLPQLKNNQKSLIVYWKKTNVGWVKLNIDRASRGNPGTSGAGGIVRNHMGQVLFAFTEPLGITNNIVAKLKALLRGLQLCTKKGFTRIWIELDALHVIRLISSQNIGSWYLQSDIQKIRFYLAQLETKISHIILEGNQAADFLANQACATDNPSILFNEQLQDKLAGTIKLDALCLPYIRSVVT